MSDYNDGNWHGWNGGECPVHPKSKVQVADYNGISPIIYAADLNWEPITENKIAAFRVVKKFEEPKVIWVNEYPNGNIHSYHSEVEARVYAGDGTLRVAVKYMECQDD